MIPFLQKTFKWLFAIAMILCCKAVNIDEVEQKATAGNASAQCELGYCYARGDGVEKSYEEAVKWFRKAAEQGHSRAQYNLGACYARGNGVTKSKEEAFKWYLKSAEQGYATAQYSLGKCYYEGDGVSKSYIEAAKWYRKALENGYRAAGYNLGICYMYGFGVTRSAKEAFKLYYNTAESGHALAQYAVGVSYSKGLGTILSHEEAVKWLKLSANQNCAIAQYHLGVAYANGHGVEQSYTKAVEWFHKAAASGYPLAQYSLGVYYEYGLGVEPSVQEAQKWYSMVADKNPAVIKALAERSPVDVDKVSMRPSSPALNNEEAQADALSRKRAVFRIFAKSDEGISSGTGFLVSKEEGLVATCSHVVSKATDILVYILSEDGQSASAYSANVVTENRKMDFAILRFKTPPANLPPPFELTKDSAEILDEVLAFGFPAVLDIPHSFAASSNSATITEKRFSGKSCP